MSGEAATRHGYLELDAERGFMQEGFAFLDEKRLLLARRILAEQDAHRQLAEALVVAWNEAIARLSVALAGGGLHRLATAEVRRGPPTLPPLARSSHLGVPQLQVDLASAGVVEQLDDEAPGEESDADTRCAVAFARVAELAQLVAASAGNLQRLVDEYRRTDRRARALENVVLPEVVRQLQRMEAVLEDLDLEEVTRIHLAVKRRDCRS